MPVRHVFAKANIADHHQIAHFALDGPGGSLHNAIFCPRAGSDFIFFLRQAKQNYSTHAQLFASCASFTASSTEILNTPGIELISLRTPSPGHTNSG